MIKITQRGTKKYATSSYFDDIKLLKRSKYDSNMRELKNSNFDVNRLQLAYVTQEIILWKQGCRELTEYVIKSSNEQLNNLETVYPGRDWDELLKEPPPIETEQNIEDPDNIAA